MYVYRGSKKNEPLNRTKHLVGGRHRAVCGTPAGYQAHRRHNEEQCERCAAAHRLDVMHYSNHGRQKVAECGTPAGYQRHRKKLEEACGPCKAAAAAQRRELRKRAAA